MWRYLVVVLLVCLLFCESNQSRVTERRAQEQCEAHTTLSLTSSDFLAIVRTFVSGQSILPALVATDADPNLHFTENAHVQAVFLREALESRSLLGFFTYDKESDSVLSESVFLSDPKSHPQGKRAGWDTRAKRCYINDGTAIDLGEFPAGTHLGFFLHTNGYTCSSTKKKWYSLQSKNADGARHFAVLHDQSNNRLIFGVEESWGTRHEADFADFVFMVIVTPGSALGDALSGVATEERAPDPVPAPTVSAITSSSVEIAWSTPKANGASVDSYDILVREDQNAEIASLVAHYEFSETNGEVLDSGPNHLDAQTPSSGMSTQSAHTAYTDTSDTSISTGRFAHFDGIGLVSIPHDETLALTNQLTVTVWVRPTATQYGTVLGRGSFWKRDGFGLRVRNSYAQFILVTPEKQLVIGARLPRDDEWHHIAGVFAGDRLALYLDGDLATEDDVTPTSILWKQAETTMTIGGQSSGKSHTFEGDLDDVRVYKAALTQEQVNAVRTLRENASWRTVVASVQGSLTVNNLKPNTDYTFAVVAHTSLGTSDIVFSTSARTSAKTILANPSFELDDGTWTGIGSGFHWEEGAQARAGQRCARITNEDGATGSRGVRSTVFLNQGARAAVVIKAFAKADGVEGEDNEDDYALACDFEYTDESTETGGRIAFGASSRDWENRRGTVYFDQVDVREDTAIPVLTTCRAVGDPHIRTFDGLRYDFQGAGEYWLVKSLHSSFAVQARLGKSGSAFSIVTAVAISGTGGTRMSLSTSGAHPVVKIDGLLQTLSSDTRITRADGTISVRGTLWTDNLSYVYYDVVGMQVELRVRTGTSGQLYIQVFVSIPVDAPHNAVNGLCGSADGNTANDLMPRGGQNAISIHERTYENLYDSFGDSWRLVHDTGESLFDYEPGETTDTFTDRAYPGSMLTPEDFDDGQRAVAVAICTERGASSNTLRACVLDLLGTLDTTLAVGNIESESAGECPNRRTDVGKSYVCYHTGNGRFRLIQATLTLLWKYLGRGGFLPNTRAPDGFLYDCECECKPDTNNEREILANPTMETLDGNLVADWQQYESGYSITVQDFRGTASVQVIAVTNAEQTDKRGAAQLVMMDREDVFPLRVSGWSAAQLVSGVSDYHYSIYVDVFYKDGTKLYGQHAPFSVGSHDWERVEFTIKPTQPIDFVWVYCLFRNHQGIAYFKNVSMKEIVSQDDDDDGDEAEDDNRRWQRRLHTRTTSSEGNLVQNGFFHTPGYDGSQPLQHWRAVGTGYERSIETRGNSSSSYSVTMGAVGFEDVTGATQEVILEQTTAAPLFVSAWSRAEAVSDNGEPEDYSVLLDVEYVTRERDWSFFLPFCSGNHDFELAKGIFTPILPIRTVNVYLTFRGREGVVWFDDIWVGYEEDPEAIPVTTSSSSLDDDPITTLQNPSFEVLETEDLSFPSYWLFTSTGCSVSTTTARTGSNSLACTGTGMVQQTISIDQVSMPPIRIGVFGKADSVEGSQDSTFSLSVNVTYSDGTREDAVNASFCTGTHEWEFVSVVVSGEDDRFLSKITIALVFQGSVGRVWFDDVSFSAEPSYRLPLTYPSARPGGYGDDTTDADARSIWRDREVCRRNLEGEWGSGSYVAPELNASEPHPNGAVTDHPANMTLEDLFAEATNLHFRGGQRALTGDLAGAQSLWAEARGCFTAISGTSRSASFWGLSGLSMEHYPSEELYTTLAFEDTYPFPGDGDYNDAVFAFEASSWFDASQHLAQVDITVTILARGSMADHELVLHFTRPIAGGASVIIWRFDENGVLESVYSLDTVPGNTFTEIPLCDSSVNALSSLVSNSDNETLLEGYANVWTDASPRAVGHRTEVSIIPHDRTLHLRGLRLEGMESTDDSLSPPFDPVLRIRGSGQAVHVQEVTGNAADAWVDDHPYPFGILVPGVWKWPLEGVHVTSVYPTFGFASTGHPSSEWWTNTNPECVTTATGVAVCPGVYDQ